MYFMLLHTVSPGGDGKSTQGRAQTRRLPSTRYRKICITQIYRSFSVEPFKPNPCSVTERSQN